jgi:hypothetical protein
MQHQDTNFAAESEMDFDQMEKYQNHQLKLPPYRLEKPDKHNEWEIK